MIGCRLCIWETNHNYIVTKLVHPPKKWNICHCFLLLYDWLSSVELKEERWNLTMFGHQGFSKYLLLCFTYGFGATWRWVNDERIFILWWSIPFRHLRWSQYQSDLRNPKTCLWDWEHLKEEYSDQDIKTVLWSELLCPAKNSSTRLIHTVWRVYTEFTTCSRIWSKTHSSSEVQWCFVCVCLWQEPPYPRESPIDKDLYHNDIRSSNCVNIKVTA